MRWESLGPQYNGVRPRVPPLYIVESRLLRECGQGPRRRHVGTPPRTTARLGVGVV
jgi:hypothetical protein